jgi:hypothetical protein
MCFMFFPMEIEDFSFALTSGRQALYINLRTNKHPSTNLWLCASPFSASIPLETLAVFLPVLAFCGPKKFNMFHSRLLFVFRGPAVVCGPLQILWATASEAKDAIRSHHSQVLRLEDLLAGATSARIWKSGKITRKWEPYHKTILKSLWLKVKDVKGSHLKSWNFGGKEGIIANFGVRNWTMLKNY